MTYLITIPGTHGIVSGGGWWKPGSRWWDAAERHGFKHPCPEDPFFWDTDLEGTIGENWGWQAAGAALRWWIGDKLRSGIWPETWIVAFSHGGQVAAYCQSIGPRIAGLITVGTPVRQDMKEIYRKVSRPVGKWHHIHSDEADIWQAAGSLGGPGWWAEGFTRQMPYAENIEAAGLSHHMLVNPAIWDSRGWWELLR